MINIGNLPLHVIGNVKVPLPRAYLFDSDNDSLMEIDLDTQIVINSVSQSYTTEQFFIGNGSSDNLIIATKVGNLINLYTLDNDTLLFLDNIFNTVQDGLVGISITDNDIYLSVIDDSVSYMYYIDKDTYILYDFYVTTGKIDTWGTTATNSYIYASTGNTLYRYSFDTFNVLNTYVASFTDITSLSLDGQGNIYLCNDFEGNSLDILKLNENTLTLIETLEDVYTLTNSAIPTFGIIY